MARLPDLVLHTKLEVVPARSYTAYIYKDPDPTSRRLIVREERWRRTQLLGSGSYGDVWLEECVSKLPGQSASQLRALKRIRLGKKGRLAPEKYMQELEAIAKFSHRNYVRCFVESYGWYEEPEALSIVMEFLQLGDLAEYLSDNAPLKEEYAGSITSQIVEGLSFMHEAGFAHRDLKPDNILIKSMPPDAWWVKIGDFGISKRAEGQVGPSLTLKGTLGYLAPELHGLTPRGTDFACDMWAVGEMAFQILANKLTFANIGLLNQYVAGSKPFPASDLDSLQVSRAGQEFIRLLMAPKPEARLQSQNALNHQWIAHHIVDDVITPPDEIIKPQEPHILKHLEQEVPVEQMGSWDTLLPESQTTDYDHFKQDTLTVPPGSQTIVSATRNSTVAMNNSIQHMRLDSSNSIQRITNAVLDGNASIKFGDGPRGHYEIPYEHNPGRAPTQTSPAFDSGNFPTGSLQDMERLQEVLKGRENAGISFQKDQFTASSRNLPDVPNKARDSTHVNKIPELNPSGLPSLRFEGVGKVNIHMLKPQGDITGCLALSPIQSYVAYVTGFNVHRIRVISLDGDGASKTQGLLRLLAPARKTIVFDLQKQTVCCLAFAASEKWIVSGSRNGTISLWGGPRDHSVGQRLLTIKAHDHIVLSVAISPYEQRIASVSWDRESSCLEFRVWDRSSTRLLWKSTINVSISEPLMSPRDFPRDFDPRIEFSPDERYCAYGVLNQLNIWHANSGLIRHVLSHRQLINGIAFSPDSTKIASCSEDRTVYLWNLGNSYCLFELQGHMSPVYCLAFSGDGCILASGSFNEILIWNVATGRLLRKIDFVGLAISIMISPDKRLFTHINEEEFIMSWKLAWENV